MRSAAEPLVRLNVRPDHVSWTGAAAGVAAAVLVAGGWLVPAGVALLVSGALDMLDGALARAGGRATAYGAFLDSTLDRVGEGLVFAAIALRFAEQGRAFDAGLVVIALLAALLVSYTRARAEGLGVRCEVGILTRPERVLILVIGMFLNSLDIAIYLLALLGALTVAQRVVHVRRHLRRHGNGA